MAALSVLVHQHQQYARQSEGHGEYALALFPRIDLTSRARVVQDGHNDDEKE